jgi:hypothetical protein
VTIRKYEKMRVGVVVADFGSFRRPDVRNRFVIFCVELSVAGELDLASELEKTAENRPYP